MDKTAQVGILIAVVTAIVTSILNFIVQYFLSKSHYDTEIRKERLTKLLLPLYFQLRKEGVMFEAEIAFENGDPAAFMDDLPKYYETFEVILKEYLYLADDELTDKALKFISWVNVARYDSKRYEKIMTTGIEDEALSNFKKCVFRQYEHEKKRFLNK